MNERCYVTVFTPTYNRESTLQRLYNSLLSQTNFNFEWLVIDDGSIDKTEELMKSFINDNPPFHIRYFKQKNQGKHVAINSGTELACGELFFIVDSDDYLVDSAIKKIIEWDSTVSPKSEFAGIAGLKGVSEDVIIGTSFKGNYVDATSLEREHYSISGDKAEVFYTDVLRAFKFPVFNGENFVTEALVWNRIAEKGLKIRWFNEIIYIADYREDGISANQNKMLANNPIGYALYIKDKIRLYGYSNERINDEYYDYYQIVKSCCSLKEVANNLEISRQRLLIAIFDFYIRTLYRKIKK